MKSAVFYGKHEMKIKEVELPIVGPDDVLVKVKACGVCGTDVHIYEGDKGAAEVTPPTILGHEFAGIVAKVGKNVTKYKEGDRVCVDPNCYCGNCKYCRSGIAHYCTDMIGYGTTMNGGFAEYCSVNQKQIYPIGDNTTFEKGAMAEPVACCLHGIDMCNIHPGSNVVIIGGGMIGLLMMQLSKLSGATKVALLEPVEKKRETAMKLGADFCIDPIKEDVKAKLKENGMTWVNVVIECVGRPSTIEQAIDIAGNKAVVMMFGLTKPDETISLKPFEIFQKEIELKASYINPYTHKRAIELIDSARLDVSSMIYEVCGLEKLEDILSKPELRANGKYIIAPYK
ncbi:zinc-dependent alcohol dehydrogenase family protein [Clostridium uliginosum]|uniref:2-desacetyl-2-hydroxyethyl bacteriochlorophyllide A dehydrogenase n=1 Tax=Clostridium uliginosum TaxID=119641 RepID=A0A1I1MY28_9CLOT|nr:zinc-dependent alcohol dehydrogenase family protein [Clostridium uliginosum]SFC88138.1 2-desacetyl-2-hydroxyethyl bacteriochlorophyllide A dehydrogenase [Clostridium uliginosum]